MPFYISVLLRQTMSLAGNGDAAFRGRLQSDVWCCTKCDLVVMADEFSLDGDESSFKMDTDCK